MSNVAGQAKRAASRLPVLRRARPHAAPEQGDRGSGHAAGVPVGPGMGRGSSRDESLATGSAGGHPEATPAHDRDRRPLEVRRGGRNPRTREVPRRAGRRASRSTAHREAARHGSGSQGARLPPPGAPRRPGVERVGARERVSGPSVPGRHGNGEGGRLLLAHEPGLVGRELLPLGARRPAVAVPRRTTPPARHPLHRHADLAALPRPEPRDGGRLTPPTRALRITDNESPIRAWRPERLWYSPGPSVPTRVAATRSAGSAPRASICSTPPPALLIDGSTSVAGWRGTAG